METMSIKSDDIRMKNLKLCILNLVIALMQLSRTSAQIVELVPESAQDSPIQHDIIRAFEPESERTDRNQRAYVSKHHTTPYEDEFNQVRPSDRESGATTKNHDISGTLNLSQSLIRRYDRKFNGLIGLLSTFERHPTLMNRFDPDGESITIHARPLPIRRLATTTSRPTYDQIPRPMLFE